MATRLQLRRRIGEKTGDLLLVTCTDPGDTQTAIDAVRLSISTGLLKNRTAYAAAGTADNIGVTTRVSGNSRAQTSLTVAPPFPAATAVGDEIEVWNEDDQGITPGRVHAWLDEAVDAVAPVHLIDAATVEVTFARATPLLALPADWVGVYAASWQDARGLWRELPRGSRALRVDRVSRTVELLTAAARLADGRPVRLHGKARPGPMLDDAAVAPVDPEWLVTQVAAWAVDAMSANRWGQAKAEYMSRGAGLQQQADALRGKARSGKPAGYQSL